MSSTFDFRAAVRRAVISASAALVLVLAAAAVFLFALSAHAQADEVLGSITRNDPGGSPSFAPSRRRRKGDDMNNHEDT